MSRSVGLSTIVVMTWMEMEGLKCEGIMMLMDTKYIDFLYILLVMLSSEGFALLSRLGFFFNKIAYASPVKVLSYLIIFNAVDL